MLVCCMTDKDAIVTLGRSLALDFPLISSFRLTTIILTFHLVRRADSINFGQKKMDDSDDDDSIVDCPSPPPFYRVSGHFTFLNPSRPMVLAEMFESVTIQENDDDGPSTSEAPSLDELGLHLEGEDLSTDLDSIAASDFPCLERIHSYIFTNPSEYDEETSTGTKSECRENANSDTSTYAHSRIAQAPEGLAFLLKSPSFDSTSSGQRRYRRWTSEEDDILRASVEIEEGPPHNWTRIANKYFRGSRTGLGCKRRWNMVSQPIAQGEYV